MSNFVKKYMALICALAVVLSTIAVSFTVNAVGDDGLIENSGYTVGQKIAEMDPSTLAVGNVSEHNGWTITQGFALSREDKMAVKLEDYNQTTAEITKEIDAENFVVVAVLGSNNSDGNNDGLPWVRVNNLDANGNRVSKASFGFTQQARLSTQTPGPGKYYYENGDNLTVLGDVTFEDDGHTIITLTLYRYNGVYTCYANGELITTFECPNAVKSVVSVGDYNSRINVHGIDVYELTTTQEPEVTLPEGIIENNGYEVGEQLAVMDPSGLAVGAVSELNGWAIAQGFALSREDKMAVKLEGYDSSDTATRTGEITKEIDAENFVVVAVLGSNNADGNNDGTPWVRVNNLDASGNRVSKASFGFTHQATTKSPGAGKYYYEIGDNLTTVGDVTFDADNHTIITITLYRYNGVYTCYANGELMATFECPNAERSVVSVGDYNSRVYVHGIHVFELTSGPEPEVTLPEGIVEDSGYEVGDQLDEMDPSGLAVGNVSEHNGWAISQGYALSRENKMAVKLQGYLSGSSATSTGEITKEIDADNYVVVAILGSNNADGDNDGTPWVRVNNLDESGNLVSKASFGFTHQGTTKYPGAGKYYYEIGSDLTTVGDVEFDTDDHTIITLTLYRYNGVYTCFANGERLAAFSCEDGARSVISVGDYNSRVYVHDIAVYELTGRNALETTTVNGIDAYTVGTDVEDNESYKVSFDYSASADVKVGFFTADADSAETVGYVEAENAAIYTANGDGIANVLFTVDKNEGMGETLYMYVVDGDITDITVSYITYNKLTDVAGGSLLSNKGASILAEVPANETQALRFYFSYDTTDGDDIVIDGQTYTVKQRGFLFANGEKMGNEQVTRSIVGTNVKERYVTEFKQCWQVNANNDSLESSNIWFSSYVYGFEPDGQSYNDTLKLYVKGYVIVEVDGVDFTLYSQETNTTVSEVASKTP